MKTRTAAFDYEWGDSSRRIGVYAVKIARRYWNGAAYVLEAQTTLDNSIHVVDIGPISQKLDSPIEATFLNSNCTLKLSNKAWAWLPANSTDGQWKHDAIATSGYVPFGSQFQIYYGYTNDTGDETLAIFTGYVDDLIFDSQTGVVQVSLAGREVLLQNSDAEKTSTALSSQVTSPANGDGSNLIFSTSQASIWRIRNVYVDGVLKTQGTHYTLSNINDAVNNATITFTAGNAPTNLKAVTWDGDKWYINNSIGTLVGLLCDTAGIAAGNRSIDEPIFPGGASSSQTITSEADWEAGTVKTNLSTTASPGDAKQKWFLLDDFTDNDYTNSPTWSLLNAGGSFTAATGALVGTNTPSDGAGFPLLSVPFAPPSAVGTWRFRLSMSNNSAVFFMMNSQAQSTGNPTGGGYYINGSSGGACSLYSRSSGAILALGTISAGYHEWRITRTVAGLFEVFVDGVSKGTVTNTDYTSGFAYFLVGDYGSSGSTSIDDIYWSPDVDGSSSVTTATTVFESAVLDLLTAPYSWGAIDAVQTLNGGTIAYYAAASTDGVSFDAYVAVNGSNVIQSALKRYVKIKAVITSVALGFVSPVISSIVVNYAVSQLFIASADFSGLTCADAITTLAIMGGMEWGTKGDGTVFFRSKSVSAGYDIDLDESTSIIKVESYSMGYADVKNAGQVTYNSYVSTKDGASESEAAPTSETTYGRIVYSLSLGNFLFSNSAQVADSIARKLYTDNYRPKFKMTILCRIIPQIELSDRARISFYDGDLLRANIFGDKAQKGFPASSSPMNVLARKITMKVVGATHHVMDGTTQLNLEAIL